LSSSLYTSWYKAHCLHSWSPARGEISRVFRISSQLWSLWPQSFSCYLLTRSLSLQVVEVSSPSGLALAHLNGASHSAGGNSWIMLTLSLSWVWTLEEALFCCPGQLEGQEGDHRHWCGWKKVERCIGIGVHGKMCGLRSICARQGQGWSLRERRQREQESGGSAYFAFVPGLRNRSPLLPPLGAWGQMFGVFATCW
jgi:hypothetical protein